MIRGLLDRFVRRLPDPEPIKPLTVDVDRDRVWTLDELDEMREVINTDREIRPVRLDPVLTWLINAQASEPHWGSGHPFLGHLIERRLKEVGRRV